MRQAVEDHRASAGHAPRSIYGRIVAEADRVIDPATIIRRTVQYGLDHCPGLDREGHFYLKLWIPESENARQLEALREVIRNPELIRKAFDEAFDAETAKPPLPEPEKR